MHECQILVRLKKTFIKKKHGEQYGNCQICNEKHSRNCIEASSHDKFADFIVFLFCNDCYFVVNDICSRFVFNKQIYNFENSYHIREKPIKKKICKCSSFSYLKFPFIIGNKTLF